MRPWRAQDPRFPTRMRTGATDRCPPDVCAYPTSGWAATRTACASRSRLLAPFVPGSPAPARERPWALEHAVRRAFPPTTMSGLDSARTPSIRCSRRCWRRSTKPLAPFRRLGGHTLIALDGTEYFTSGKLHCPNCSQRRRRPHGILVHTMLSATLVARHREVVPLAPEFIAPQDGADKQDCEQQAVHRWFARHGGPTAVSPRFTWATTCSPVSPPARRCMQPGATSCSSAPSCTN